jgi:AcrR family transcriptional regulator
MSIGKRPSEAGRGGGDPVSAPAPRRPGRPRALPVEEQRRVVVDAARSVFAREGYNGTTIERVAREAGTARSSVYELFAGKDELFVAVVEDSAERVVRHMRENFQASEGRPLRDFARHSFSIMFDLIDNDRDSIILLLNAERNGVEPPMAAVADTRRRVLAEIDRYTGTGLWADYGIEVGSASVVLSHMYFGMAEEVALIQAGDDSWDRDALIELLTEFTVGGLFRLALHPEALHVSRHDRAGSGAAVPVEAPEGEA